MTKKILATFFLTTALLCSAEYIIPPEYDNTVLSARTKNEVLITNLAPLLSSNSYPIGGRTHRFRCVSIPKIQCRNGRTSRMNISLRSIPTLKEPIRNESVPVYAVATEYEDAGTFFRVCGGALGTANWDNAVLTQTGDIINFTYSPLANQLAYYFFTDATGNISANNGSTVVNGGEITGSNISYMVIEAQQTCQ